MFDGFYEQCNIFQCNILIFYYMYIFSSVIFVANGSSKARANPLSFIVRSVAFHGTDLINDAND
jgi:hypothetical protein